MIAVPPKAKYYFDKLLSFLRVRPLVAGLEISDAIMRLVYFDGEAWRMGGVRLAPGVMEAGAIKDREKFVAALGELKEKVFDPRDRKKRINAIVSLSSISIYSQVFSLPIIEGENLEKAVKLNIQMVSPLEASEAYSGWQLVGEDQGSLRLEILSAFIERSTVDELGRLLLEAGFLMIVLESRALAMARVLREAGEGIEENKPYIVVSLDNSGLDFLIIRRGQLYFEYFNPWREAVDESGQISMPALEAMVVRNLHQVINFYGQHWSEPLEEIIMSATGLADEMAKIIGENFSIPVRKLRVGIDQNINADWFIALGCGLRARKPRGGDKEISLLGIGAEEEFRREQLADFIKFWRIVMPVALGFLAATFFLSDLFLIQTRKELGARPLLSIDSEREQESQTLQAEAKEFNRLVTMIGAAEKARLQKSGILKKLTSLAADAGIAMEVLSFSGPDKPLQLRGSGRLGDDVFAFQKLLEGDPGFEGVNLPRTELREEGGRVSFSLSFGLVRE